MFGSSIIKGPNTGSQTRYCFLYETLATSQTVDSVQRMNGYDNFLAVD